MRRILVDYARGHRAAKRGSGQPQVELDEVAVMAEERAQEVASLPASREEAPSFFKKPVLNQEALKPAPDDEPSLVDKRIGPYRLQHELGRGGMGMIYLAVRDDDQYQKRVAIEKIKQTTDAANPT